jgi:hypothetical protein
MLAHLIGTASKATANDGLAPEEPNVYSSANRIPVGAPAERNVLLDECVETYISLRWSEEPYCLGGVYKHLVPTGLSARLGKELSM